VGGEEEEEEEKPCIGEEEWATLVNTLMTYHCTPIQSPCHNHCPPGLPHPSRPAAPSLEDPSRPLMWKLMAARNTRPLA